jgi:hypothetical protein
VTFQTVKIVKSAPKAETVQASRENPVFRRVALGVGFGFYVVRSVLRSVGILKGEGTMQPVDLNKLVEPYFGTGLYLAVTKDNTAVVATGKTIQDAVDQAAGHGYAEPIIMRAPTRKAMENSLHL